MMVLFGVLGLVVLVFFGGVAFIYHSLFRPSMPSHEYTRSDGLQKGEFDEDFLNAPWQEVYLPGSRGNQIWANVLLAQRDGPGTVVFVHGIAWTWHGMLKYAKHFYQGGWHVVCLDQPGHGASKIDPRLAPSLGWFESQDLICACTALRSQRPEFTSGRFGLVGESMGAATSLLVGNKLPGLDFVVADCGFDNALEELRVRARAWNIPEALVIPLTETVRWFAKSFRGFDLKEVSPLDSVKASTLPVCLVHGLEDRYVPYIMAARMFDARQGGHQGQTIQDALKSHDLGKVLVANSDPGLPNTKLVLVPGARHAAAARVAPDLWVSEVFTWIKDLKP